MTAYTQLKTIFQRITHLQYLQRILLWDEAVMMPIGAGPARAAALASFNRTLHQLFLSKRIQRLLAEANEELLADNWDQANLGWMRKLQTRAEAVPLSLVEKATKAQLACEQAWREMRAKNDWRTFQPYLERSFAYVLEIANLRAAVLGVDPYDALLDEYAPGFTQATIDPIFTTLQSVLPGLLIQIQTKQQTQKKIKPIGPFLPEKQKSLGLEVMRDLGFDFNHGRVDVSHHPFCSGGPQDVRLTTRYAEHEFLSSLLAICHETGHALYEQGLPQAWLEQPVGGVHSMAMHESQSLLIETEVCHAAAFTEYLLPKILATFDHQAAFTCDNLLLVMNEVRPGFIRVDADEVSYPLHVILRYEIEKALFNAKFTIADLPHVWDELMKKYLGLSTKDNFRQGVMQDVHWPSGAFGYFPAYTLGRLMAAQFYAAFNREQPNFEEQIKIGNFHPLLSWLRQHVHSQGSLMSTEACLVKATGEPLNPKYFLEGLQKRYLSN